MTADATADNAPDSAPVQADEKTVRKAVIASAMGNAIEWYDFGVFSAGVMTSIVGGTFFPKSDFGDVLALSMIAIAFTVRPFGGAFFGSLGDKYGRKRVLATTILLISGSTFLIGVLPGYATIGIASPMLLILIRLLQGFSTGGEYGGAATFMAEYAPTKTRGKLGSFLEFGTLSGYVLGAGLVLIMELAVGKQAMSDWGFRIPFLLALPLGLVGLYLRSRLEDTPAFQAMEKSGKVSKSPLRETFSRNWKMILNLIGIVFLLNIADYIVLTTMPTYFTKTLHMSDNASSLLVIGAEVFLMIIIVPIGALSDRIGRKPLLLTAAIGYLVLSWPAFSLMKSGNTFSLILGFLIVAVLLVLMLAVIGSTFPAMFPTRARYGSFAIGYNISTSIFGGTASALTTYLIQVTGDDLIPAYYLMLAGAVAIVPILLIPETARVPIHMIRDSGRIDAGAQLAHGTAS